MIIMRPPSSEKMKMATGDLSLALRQRTEVRKIQLLKFKPKSENPQKLAVMMLAHVEAGKNTKNAVEIRSNLSPRAFNSVFFLLR